MNGSLNGSTIDFVWDPATEGRHLTHYSDCVDLNRRPLKVLFLRSRDKDVFFKSSKESS